MTTAAAFHKSRAKAILEVDWSSTRDTSIAMQWGISRERVRQIRKALDLPFCVNKHKSRNQIEFFKKHGMKKIVTATQTTDYDIASVMRWCKNGGLTFKNDIARKSRKITK